MSDTDHCEAGVDGAGGEGYAVVPVEGHGDGCGVALVTLGVRAK